MPRSPSVWRVWIEIAYLPLRFLRLASPSVWRVWIEIEDDGASLTVRKSPSVWRVWIEIGTVGTPPNMDDVTLRVEGVD